MIVALRTCSPPQHRVIRLLLAIVVSVLALPLFTSSAEATVYPPGRIGDGYSKAFYNYAWLGTGLPYDNYGDYVVGVQRELRYISQVINISPPGSSNDGIFGSGTKQSVKDFQSSQGLTVDGVVGNNTWWSLWSWLRYDYNEFGYEMYYVWQNEFSLYWRFGIAEQRWQIRKKDNSWLVLLDSQWSKLEAVCYQHSLKVDNTEECHA